MAILAALPLQRFPALAMIDRVFETRADVTAYDTNSCALAEHLECALLTGDATLAAMPGPRCPIEVSTAT